MFKNFRLILLITLGILIGCQNNKKIQIDIAEYNNLINIRDELSRDYNQLNLDYNSLIRQNNRLQQNFNNLNDQYLIIKNIPEIIEYENLLKEMENLHGISRRVNTYTVIEGSRYNLLFDKYNDGLTIFGLTIIEGYYTKVKWSIDLDEEIEIDGFVIINGERAFIDSIKKRWLIGNTWFKISENGHPIALIKIDQLNENLQHKIKNSSINTKISLSIFILDLATDQIMNPPYIEILDVY